MPHQVRFGLRCSQHQREWAEIREWFITADELGFETAWVFDHILPLSEPRTGPNLEAWTLLAGLAEATSSVEMGPMVTGITYRYPAMLLKEITTVDHISNGRALISIGAAWFEGEHEMFGIPFPRAGDRVTMLHEALQIFKLLQSQDLSTFEGTFYSVKDAIFEPKPVRNPMPVVIGGSQPRMLGIIAEFADQWDNNFRDADEYRQRLATLEEACQKIGRDPSEIRRSTTLGADFLTSNNEDQIRDELQKLRDLGITDFLFHVPEDVAPVRNFAEQIMPGLRQQWAN